MATFGSISEFNANIEPWAQYVERFRQYLLANEIVDPDRQRAIFLTLIGPTTYGLLKNLLLPQLPTSRTLEQLVNTLSSHFEPVPSEIVERFKFNSRYRKSGETVATFIAELRRLAKYCNFGNSLDMMLRDRIVCGIQNENMQRKLLSEPDLTLVRTTEIALAMESAAKSAVDLKGGNGFGSNEVHSIKSVDKIKKNYSNSKNFKATTKPKEQREVKCFRCGAINSHIAANCKFINAICHFCKAKGHIKRVCNSRLSGRKGQKVNLVQEETILEPAQTEIPQYDLFKLDTVGEAPPPARISCCIEGQQLEMDIDSGAPFSLIPLKTFENFKDYFPPLEKTGISLRSFTKHTIDIVGVIKVNVSFKSKSKQLPLVVVKQGNVNLAGRNWIYPLKLWTAFNTLDESVKLMTHEKFSNPELNSVTSGVTAPAGMPKDTLSGILAKHSKLFSPGVGHIKGLEVQLTMRPTATPRYFKARPVPYALKEKVDAEIDRLLHEGIIKEVKSSDWAAPVVPVLKRDGNVRLCGDFKLTVNQATELEDFPLPKIEDLFAQVGGGKMFSKLDLLDAYCQLPLAAKSQELVVINTHRGLFKYTRLPFGVASAPAVFQREMEKILQAQPGAMCYLDDLLVTGSTEQEHLQNLDRVLTLLEEAGIKLNKSKCVFMKNSVEYLGHVIDKEGLHPVEAKLEAIEKAPTPVNVEQLRSFLGLLTYYAKFLPNMSTLLAPLYRLLEKQRKWIWTDAETKVFKEAKEVLKNSQLLVHFDNNKEVILACDASPYGLGAVLSHRTATGERPIAFASRSLSKAEKNYSHLEKEALALIFGVTRFRNYLLGREFILLTDHHPLLSLLSEKKPVPEVAASRIQRWALTLAAYAYRIQFRKGTLNANADACSRLPIPTTVPDPPMPNDIVLLLEAVNDSPVTAYHIQKEIGTNPLLKQVRNYIREGWPKTVSPELVPFWQCRKELSCEAGVILRGNRVFIPEKFRQFVMDELHEGHPGMSAMKATGRASVWWPRIDFDIEQKVRSCTDCQLQASMPPAIHIPWPKPKAAWERIHIDHAGPFEGRMLLVVVDAGSKWLEVAEVPSTSTLATINVLKTLFARFGLPRSLVSDNGTSFTSGEFKTFMESNGIVHIRTAPFHPNSNGIAERAVRTVKTAMKKTTGIFKDRLETFLACYRRTPRHSGVSPAVAMFGRSPRTRLDLLCPREAAETKKQKRQLFQKGEKVWARNYGQGPKWVEGSVTETRGQGMLEVSSPSKTLFRHLDQVRRVEPRTVVIPASKLPEVTEEEPRLQSEPSGLEMDAGEKPSVDPGAVPKVSAVQNGTPDQGSTAVGQTLRRSNRARKAPDRFYFVSFKKRGSAAAN